MDSPTDNVLPARTAVARRMMVVDDAHVTYRVHAADPSAPMRSNLLSLSTLRGGRTLHTVHAVRGISFEASEGESVGVVGHNGSGKSTLFKAMGGLIPTSGGAIWAADRPVLLGVNAALQPALSGASNIKLGLLAMGFAADEAAAKVDEIAEFAELNDFIHHPMRTYSSGMAARLRFAIGSAKTHSILLVDEALAVGDRRFRTKSEDRIRRLRDDAGLVMIVSHSLGSLKENCERVLWIHKGELRADGPTSEVLRQYIRWAKNEKSISVGAASVRNERRSADTARRGSDHEASSLSTSGAVTAGGSAGAIADPTRSEIRAAARRARHREELRARQRRRVVALVATILTILVAIGAGAAVALLSNLPDAAVEPAGATRVRMSTQGPPAVGGALSGTGEEVAAI